MEKIINITFIFFFLFSASIQSDCPIIPYPRRTYLGFINAQINNDPNLHGKQNHYSYPLNQQLIKSGLNVAVGIVSFQLIPNSQIQFNIQYSPSNSLTTVNFKVKLQSQNNGWRMLRFSFFTSQSIYFRINTQTINQFSVGVDSGRYAIYRPIPNFSKLQSDIVIKIFLSGVCLKAKPLDDQFKSILDQYQSFKKFQTNGILVKYFSQAIQYKKSLQLKLSQPKIIGKLYTFMIQTNTQLISLSFSYIIFNINILTQLHNFISDSFSFINNDQYKFTSLQNMDMLMTGLIGFNIPRQNLYIFTLGLNNLGGQSYYNLKTNYKYLQIYFTYVSIQMKINYVCQDCTNSPIIYDNKFCVEQCPRSYSISDNNGVKYCDKCDIDKLKVIDPQTNLCVCAKKHYFDVIFNSCLPCRYDCMSCDTKNKCLTCQNSLLQTKRVFTSDGFCQCPAIGYYDDMNNQDIICQKCHRNCLSCKGPYAHNCLSCQVGRQKDGKGFCACKNGFIEDFDGNCICPNPKILTQNNICIEPTNNSCPPDKIQQYVDQTRRCICKPGYTQIQDQCIQCKNNSRLNQQTLKCECIKQTVQVNGECKNCQINQIYDQIYKICVCKDGTYQSQNGTCVICPHRMVLINQKCQCVFNYYEDAGGICRRCLREIDGPKCKRNLY